MCIKRKKKKKKTLRRKKRKEKRRTTEKKDRERRRRPWKRVSFYRGRDDDAVLCRQHSTATSNG